MRTRRLAVLLLLALACTAAARAGTVAGVVTDESGQPIPGAVLWNGIDLPGAPDAPTAVSGPDGRFTVPAPLPGKRLWLLACAPGFVNREMAKWEIPAEPFRFALGRAARIAGRIVAADGTPVARAEIDASREGSSMVGHEDLGPCRFPSSYASAVSGPDGRFTLDRLEAGRYSVGADALGFVPDGPASLFHAVAGETLKIPDIVLDRGATVSGRIVAADGSPAAGALVTLATGGFSEVAADAEGRYRLGGVRPGAQNRLRARHPDLGSGEVAFPALPVLAGENRVDVHLSHPGEISGRAAGPDGQPGAGAISGTLHGLDSFAGVQIYAIDAQRSRPGTVDSLGRYRFSGLASGSWKISASRGLRHTQAEVAVAPGTQETVADLTFPPAFAVRGRVTAEGLPLARVRVELGEMLWEETDDGGWLAVELEPGTYPVTVRRPNGSVFQAPPLTVRGAVDGWEVTLPFEVVLRGRFPGLRPEEAAFGVTAWGPAGQVLSGTIGEDGGYEVRGLEPGSWKVSVECGDSTVTQSFTIPQGVHTVTHDLPFPRGGETFVAHSKYVSCWADLSNYAGFKLYASFDRDGLLRISGLAPGTYQFLPHCVGRVWTVTLPQTQEMTIGGDPEP